MKKDIDNGLGQVEDLAKTGRGLTDDEPDDDGEGLVFGDEDEEIPPLVADDEDDDPGEGDPDEYAGEDPDAADPGEGEEPAPDIKAEDDPDPDAVDEDLAPYSRRVQKRVMRERKLKAKAEREAETLRAELASAKKELEERKARQAEADIDDRLQKAIDEFEDARRDADTRKEVEAQAKVTRLVEERNQIEERKQRRTETGDAEGAENKPHPAFAAWKQRNPWFDKPEHRAQRAAAIQLAQQIMQDEGLDDTDARLYLRLSAKLPTVIKVPGAPEKAAPRRTTIGRTPEGSASGRRKTLQIDAQTRAFMTRLQLDPTNKEHVETYLREQRNASR